MDGCCVETSYEEIKLNEIPSINIEFEDLSYFLQLGNLKIERKQILKSVNGKFISGELTGILGASGAGKTTLLNVLAGYVVKGVQGNVKINGRSRKLESFHKFSTYIMQENLIQPYLTVQEEMTVYADLKLGNRVSPNKKLLMVEEILRMFRLSNCHKTRVENLSGGEKKRLSIALELVSNPPIIFLDEPTSGLDSVAIRQCIDVLKRLTGEGRTVICTIHQPSVPIMQQFDQVYFMANGECVYNGPVVQISTFLNSLQLECPLTSTHAEFVIETVETNPALVPILVEATKNGKNYLSSNEIEYKDVAHFGTDSYSVTSFWTQLHVLLQRMVLQQSRNKLALWIQFFNHTLCGLLHGGLFYGIGNDASQALTNFKLCLCILLFFLYTYIMTPILLFPFEVKIMKREHFNRWYGLSAYYTAVTLRNLPILLVLGTESILITYLMTDQPLELCRFLRFSFAAILVGLIAESVGLAIGAVFNCRNGAIFGPALIAPWVFFTIYGMGYSTRVKSFMKFMMGTSFVRYGIVGMTISVAKDRDPLHCSEEAFFCYYKNTNNLLRDLGILNTTYETQMAWLVFFLVFFRLIAYIALRVRVNPDWSSIRVSISKKIMGKK